MFLWGVARLPQRGKINICWNFWNGVTPKGPAVYIVFFTCVPISTYYQSIADLDLKDQDRDLKITFWSDLRSLFRKFQDHDLDLILDHFFGDLDLKSRSLFKITFLQFLEGNYTFSQKLFCFLCFIYFFKLACFSSKS